MTEQSVPSKRMPWLRWYPADWRADPRLRMCSLGARGLWIELLGFMHESERYGHLVIEGSAPTPNDIAALVGSPLKSVRKFLAELELRGVYSTSSDGFMFSRRMVRDHTKGERDRINGASGGNPLLQQNQEDEPEPGLTPGRSTVKGSDKEGVNPQVIQGDKAARGHARASQMPETRVDTLGTDVPKAAEAAHFDPEKPVFDLGKELLGPRSGGQVRKLIRHHVGDLTATLDTLRLAKSKSDPREYVGAILRGERQPEIDWDAEYRRIGVSL